MANDPNSFDPSLNPPSGNDESTQQVGAPSSPASTDPPSGEPPAGQSVAGSGDPGVSGPSASTGDQGASSWRDRLSQQAGVDLSGYDSDEQALQFLAGELNKAQSLQSQVEQAQPLVQYGQEYLRHAADFQKWQQEQQAAATQEPADPYAPPEYDPAWLGMVRQDESGALVPDPARGGTPEIVSKLQNHINWRQNFAANPYKHLESFVDRRAEERAKALVEERFQQMNEQFHTQQFITNNRDWLFEHDQNGRVAVDPQGRQVLSEEGRVFSQFLQQAQQSGFEGQQQQAAAMQALEAWRFGRRGAGNGQPQQSPQQAAQQQAQQQKQDFLTQAAGFTEHTNQPAASTQGAGDPNAPPQNPNMSLADRMRADLKAAGIKDEDLVGV